MRALRSEFRFRLWIIAAFYVAGFVAPWERYLSALQGGRAWSWLALALFRTGWVTSQQSFLIVLCAAIGLTMAGAILRVWGSAYLGCVVMRAREISGTELVTDGPYRYLRNPLYAGTWLTGAGVSILMPHTGAVFFLLALTLFELRLIGAEEAYLGQRLGAPYLAYRQRVGRLAPKLARAWPFSGKRPQWLHALAAETYSVAAALSMAVFGWSYDANLLTRCVVVCFGLSLTVSAFLPPPAAGTSHI